MNQYKSVRDILFLYAALAGFILWVLSASTLRIWINKSYEQYSWFFGVLPSFLAAWTFAFWLAFLVRSKPLESVLYAIALVVSAELIQLYIPWYTFDFWDILTGLIGAASAMPVLILREHQKRKINHRI